MPSQPPRKFGRVRTPTVLQMEAVECGAAALGIILEYHGRYVPLDVLRSDCGVSRDGSNAFYIKEAAKRYGMEVQAFRKPADGLNTRRPPFMVLWQWNHFLVVEGFSRGRVYLNDPASGRRSVRMEEFRRDYSGIAFTFTPGPGFERKGRRPGAAVSLLRRLARSKSALAFVVLAGLALVLPDLLGAAFQRVYIDEILVQGRVDWLKPLLLAMGATCLVRLAAVRLQQRYLTRLEVRLALTESVKFLQHLLQLPVGFFQHRFAGDIVARATSTARVARLISGELATTLIGLLTLVIFVAAMLPVDPLLTVVGGAIGSLNLIALRWFSRWRTDQNRALEQLRGRLWAMVMWAIQIVETVKATGSEPDLMVRWTGEQARVVNGEQELGTYDVYLVALPPFLAMVGTIAILGLGGRQVAFGTLSIGALVAFQSLLGYFNQPFRDLARLGSEVQELQADLDRIDDVRNHRADPMLDGTRTAAAGEDQSVSSPRLSGRLELRSVTFGYNRTVEEPLIQNLSLMVRPGQRIALVGSSGSGKTTLARLITGLYEPWRGDILHDGRPIREIPREVFVRSVALVDERIAMFRGTVRENLTLWDDRISSDHLIQAGISAAIHRDLLARRGGYDAAVSEGARNFSGGQRQRLEIARSLIRDPSLLVLDEASSALDPRTEAMVDDHLRRRGCTCLIIAHRLSTIRDCDEIIVLSSGRVVQRGTHAQLMAQAEGEYARLLASQELPSRAGMRAGPRHGRTARERLALILAKNADPAFNPSNPETLREPDSPGEGELAEPPGLDPALPRFLIEELLPFSRPEQTAANRPLPLDDPESVWWVSRGQVDVFFTQPGPDGGPGRRRHLCRVEEGGSIFALSGVRGTGGGRLIAVGVGTADLLRFARGDLIRLSFEDKLAAQVAVLVDDWVFRVGRALSHAISSPGRLDLALDAVAEVAAHERFGVRRGVAWIRHTAGSSRFLDDVPLPITEQQARFPLSEHVWLTATEACRVGAIDTLAMVRTGDPWAGLMDFHKAVLEEVARTQQRETTQHWDELQQSIDGDRGLMSAAAIQLAATANQTEAPPPHAAGDVLLAACRAVGQAQGIEVRAPRRVSTEADETAGPALAEIARASGFHLRQVTLPPDWTTRRGGGPLLADLVEPEHSATRPVALLPSLSSGWFSARSLDLYDPVSERRSPIDPGLASRIRTTAWQFHRTFQDAPLRLPDLVRFGFAGIRREVRRVLALATVGGLLGLLVPIGSGILVDQVIPEVKLSGVGPTRLLVLCLFLLGLAVGIGVYQVIVGLTLLRIEGKLAPALVPAVWDRLLRLPASFFAGYSSGDLALRAMGLSLILKKISGAALSTLVAGLVSLFNLGLMFWYSWRLALIIALLLGLLLLVMLALLAGQLRMEIRLRAIEGTMIGFLLEIVSGITKLRTAGAESRAFARWAESGADRLALIIQARRYANHLNQAFAVFPLLIAMAIYLGTTWLDPTPQTTGDLLALIPAAGKVMTAVLAAGQMLLGLLDLPPLYQRIKPILAASPEFPAAVVEPVRLGGALALGGVSFHYAGQGEGTRILHDVSLQVRPGEFVAIVGASGSGKSTLLRLLLGFETPDSGTVTYDGRELATLDVREVRRQIGVVLQHAQLMPGDIFSNIVGFAPGLTHEDAWRAARLAGMEDDIRRMPMGMYTLVGEGGGNLSGGQRQRLLIARAIVRRPRILMFDEATSALDNVTQAIVAESISRELRGITRVVIAHRLTTVIDADRIYVVKKGRIVQAGQYHQLLEEAGPFLELVQRQSV